MKLIFAKMVAISSLFGAVACGAEEFLGEDCRDYLNFYLAFHEIGVTGQLSERNILDFLEVHPNDSSEEGLQHLAAVYVELSGIS